MNKEAEQQRLLWLSMVELIFGNIEIPANFGNEFGNQQPEVVVLNKGGFVNEYYLHFNQNGSLKSIETKKYPAPLPNQLGHHPSPDEEIKNQLLYLREQLTDAISRQDFTEAAELRDKINHLTT
jgi:hypothetical protein